MLKLAALSLLLSHALAIKCYDNVASESVTDCGSAVTQCEQSIYYEGDKVTETMEKCGCSGSVGNTEWDQSPIVGHKIACCNTENCNNLKYAVGDSYDPGEPLKCYQSDGFDSQPAEATKCRSWRTQCRTMVNFLDNKVVGVGKSCGCDSPETLDGLGENGLALYSDQLKKGIVIKCCSGAGCNSATTIKVGDAYTEVAKMSDNGSAANYPALLLMSAGVLLLLSEF